MEQSLNSKQPRLILTIRFGANIISLQFDESLVDLPSDKEWQAGETIYLTLITDADGFAVWIQLPGKNPPAVNTI
jgi:hypothetical protein